MIYFVTAGTSDDRTIYGMTGKGSMEEGGGVSKDNDGSSE